MVLKVIQLAIQVPLQSMLNTLVDTQAGSCLHYAKPPSICSGSVEYLTQTYLKYGIMQSYLIITIHFQYLRIY